MLFNYSNLAFKNSNLDLYFVVAVGYSKSASMPNISIFSFSLKEYCFEQDWLVNPPNIAKQKYIYSIRKLANIREPEIPGSVEEA